MTYKDIKMTNQVRNMKKVDGIYLTVTGFTYKPGKNSIKDQIPEPQYRDFMMYVAAELASTVVNAIDNQRYKSKWKPLSLNYMSYKKRHNLSLHIWEATGHMKKSIRVFKKRNLIAMGFDDRTVYPKSYLKVNLIARFLEFGSRDNSHPPSRPLWRPLQIYIRKNIGRYYKSYQKELANSKKQYLFLKG